ncbi:MAG: 50S ribosomal protein L3 [FCB group bacterium]|nr:50S ribosomal protein L3 [FCB group bacterium]
MLTHMLLGKKIGMSRVFDNSGTNIPVTIIEAGPCVVTQVKKDSSDEFVNIQLGFEEKKESHTSKALKGHFAAAGTTPKRYLKEYRTAAKSDLTPGAEVKVDIFKEGDRIRVTGISKGKGFAGHMKRHGFSGGRKSHGKNSVMRKSGSVGSSATPSRVWPGTRMAGNMGNEWITVKNLRVVRIDVENNQIFVKGAIPGSKNGFVALSK